ncbi:MAG: CU044_5270 family protein, partial [Trebonia sp.]
MNDSDITDLARMLPVPGARDFPAGRQQTLKEHLMTEFRLAGNTRAAPGAGRRPRSRSRITGGLTAVAAAAVAAVAVIALLAGGSGDSGGSRPVTPTAASLLAKVASTEAGEPTPVVKNGDFTYIKREITEFTAGKPASTAYSQYWQSVSDTCTPGILAYDGAPTLAEGSPPCGIGNLDDPTYRFAQTLPTSPRALLNYITNRVGQQNAFLVLDGLISRAILPPKVRAAAYGAAALLPGVTVVDNVRSELGQRGIAIQERSGQTTYQWVFNPRTLQYTGSRTYNTATGKTISESAVIGSGIV